MSDTGKVVVGLVIFLAVVSFPIWYTTARGASGERPELDKAKGDRCVEEKEWMTANHMDLIDEWRDDVVREGKRRYRSLAYDGQEHEMSLTKTCLNCHANKEAFCDRCHDYADVDPYCWDCHVIPEQKGE